MGQTQEARPRVEVFAADAADHSHVREAAVDGDRTPPRVTVEIRGARVPEGVHDRIDRFQATIVDAAARGGTLRLTVTVPEPWKDAGVRTIRQQGNSCILSLPPEALDAAALGQEQVALHARDGEIHVARHDGGPRPP
jgi:hypothetical protein